MEVEESKAGSASQSGAADSDDEAMKFSDVEDYQAFMEGGDDGNNTTGNALGFMNDDDFEEEAAPLTGEQQLEALANQYMMKSPATLAMKRKSSVYASSKEATL